MPVYENRHLLRVLTSPQDQAKHFIEYCRLHQVTTRKLCRIGTTPRNGMRGLIANMDIKKDDNVVMIPERACIHPGRALRCKPFFNIFSAEVQQRFLEPGFISNERIADRSIIRINQLLLALYMTYIVMKGDYATDQAALKYINFMPRNEGNFEQLVGNISGALDGNPLCRDTQSAIASHFNISQAEVRPVISWAITMIFSRMAPIDYVNMLKQGFISTPFAHAYDHEQGPLAKEPIAFLCPMIDMCNHSDYENVALMVPDRATSIAGPALCLRSLRDIPKGEELTMTYGGSQTELKVIWGMDKVL